MDVFIYCGDIECESCAVDRIRELQSRDVADNGDSDTYPQGPYPNGGGEADMPQHCGSCGLFLDNPLTSDGETFVRDAFGEYVEIGRGALEVIGEWKLAYSWCWDDWVEITLPLLEEDYPLKPAEKARLAELEAV